MFTSQTKGRPISLFAGKVMVRPSAPGFSFSRHAWTDRTIHRIRLLFLVLERTSPFRCERMFARKFHLQLTVQDCLCVLTEGACLFITPTIIVFTRHCHVLRSINGAKNLFYTRENKSRWHIAKTLFPR